MNTAEVIHLIKQVDTAVFCLWQGEKSEDLFGMVKDSAYEFFIAACSLFTVQHMTYLTGEQMSKKLLHAELALICGNENLTDSPTSRVGS
jgi:hypothetical protein